MQLPTPLLLAYSLIVLGQGVHCKLLLGVEVHACYMKNLWNPDSGGGGARVGDRLPLPWKINYLFYFWLYG